MDTSCGNGNSRWTEENPVTLQGWLNIGTGAQRGWGICILGDGQKSPGQGPEQPGLAWELALL